MLYFLKKVIIKVPEYKYLLSILAVFNLIVSCVKTLLNQYRYKK